MKKIALFLITLVGLVVIAGCNSNRKTVTRFTPEGEVSETPAVSETIIKVEDGNKKTDPAPIELKTETNAAAAQPQTKFEVTSLAKNISDSKKGYHVIEGTTPENTAKVLVNDTPLGKFKAGETKWSYIAAVSLGNLKKGDNKFTVKAQDKDGNQVGAETFTITYAGAETAKLASTGMDAMSLAALITLMVMGFLTFRRSANRNA